MTYIISNTISEGKGWAKVYLPKEEKFKIFSTSASIRGKSFFTVDTVYILTRELDLINALMPALVGCQVFSCNEWILKK